MTTPNASDLERARRYMNCNPAACSMEAAHPCEACTDLSVEFKEVRAAALIQWAHEKVEEDKAVDDEIAEARRATVEQFRQALAVSRASVAALHHDGELSDAEMRVARSVIEAVGATITGALAPTAKEPKG